MENGKTEIAFPKICILQQNLKTAVWLKEENIDAHTHTYTLKR